MAPGDISPQTINASCFTWHLITLWKTGHQQNISLFYYVSVYVGARLSWMFEFLCLFTGLLWLLYIFKVAGSLLFSADIDTADILVSA